MISCISAFSDKNTFINRSNIRKIGLLGGLSWSSTLAYYQTINQLSNIHIGGLYSPPVVIESLDFEYFNKLVIEEKDEDLLNYLRQGVQKLEQAETDFYGICCNTAHKVAEPLRQFSGMPFLTIGEVLKQYLTQRCLSPIGLLGKPATMRLDFLKARLVTADTPVLTPHSSHWEKIGKIIAQELGRGCVLDSSKSFFRDLIHDLEQAGAQAIVLVCTELPLLIHRDFFGVPIIDTAQTHATALFERATGLGLLTQIIGEKRV